MKLLRVTLTIAAGLALSGNAMANLELAQKSACMACHMVDKKLVGPSFKDVAAKYKGDGAAETKLLKKVKEGGSGVWGQIPMPPNVNVKDEDLKKLVKWVLSQH
jgi:cytochrome c